MRPNIDEYFIKMAQLVSTRATCIRRSVGCVLVDKNKQVVATGYNGVACGQPHCNEEAKCPGADAPSGTGLELCQAIHAEQNALLQCKDQHNIQTAYVTASPCMHCMKMLLNTSCERIIYLEEYPSTGAAELWNSAGRVIYSLNTMLELEIPDRGKFGDLSEEEHTRCFTQKTKEPNVRLRNI